MERDRRLWAVWTAETTRLSTLSTALQRRRLPVEGAFKHCQRITINQLQAVQLFGGTSACGVLRSFVMIQVSPVMWKVQT
jgi:hypothetical protein